MVDWCVHTYVCVNVIDWTPHVRATQLSLHERAAFVAVLLTFIRIHTVTTMTVLRITIVMPTGIAMNSKTLSFHLVVSSATLLVVLPEPCVGVGAGVGVVSGWEEGRGRKVFANRGIVHALFEANISLKLSKTLPTLWHQALVDVRSPQTTLHTTQATPHPYRHTSHTDVTPLTPAGGHSVCSHGNVAILASHIYSLSCTPF